MVKACEHSKELIRAFTPIRFFLVIIGQMPYDIKKKKDNTYSFKLSYTSKSWFIFLILFALNSTAYLMVTAGIFTFVLHTLFSDWINPTHLIVVEDPDTEENVAILWERYYTRREMVPVLVIWSWMTIAFTGSLYVILYGKFYVHYMNYFSRVVQMMDMDMTPGIKKYLWKHNLLTIGIAIGLLFGFLLQPLGFHAVGNTANVLANFILRLFGVEIPTIRQQMLRKKTGAAGKYIGCQLLGFLMMFLSLVGSRANIIQFLFFSQLLKNGAKIWNERFTTALEIDPVQLKVIHGPDADQFHRRLDLKQVLKDHVIMVQLYRMTESVFGSLLLTFYCFEIVALVMQVYQLAALGGFKSTLTGNSTQIISADDDDAYEADRQQEWETMSTAIVCIILIMQHIWFAIATTTDAAGAYEQAMEGFHILRQHGFMYCRNKVDRNFVLSMYMSFSKNAPMQLTASGYFAVNKALLVSMAATMVNWSVSIYQTKIDQWK